MGVFKRSCAIICQFQFCCKSEIFVTKQADIFIIKDEVANSKHLQKCQMIHQIFLTFWFPFNISIFAEKVEYLYKLWLFRRQEWSKIFQMHQCICFDTMSGFKYFSAEIVTFGFNPFPFYISIQQLQWFFLLNLFFHS